MITKASFADGDFDERYSEGSLVRAEATDSLLSDLKLPISQSGSLYAYFVDFVDQAAVDLGIRTPLERWEKTIVSLIDQDNGDAIEWLPDGAFQEVAFNPKSSVNLVERAIVENKPLALRALLKSGMSWSDDISIPNSYRAPPVFVAEKLKHSACLQVLYPYALKSFNDLKSKTPESIYAISMKEHQSLKKEWNRLGFCVYIPKGRLSSDASKRMHSLYSKIEKVREHVKSTYFERVNSLKKTPSTSIETMCDQKTAS